MKLSSLIRKEFIICGDGYKSSMEAVEDLLQLFDKKKELPAPIDEVRKVMLEREALGGTVLKPGLAIPHGRMEGFHDILTGVWIPETPLKTDTGTIKILFCFLTSKEGSPLYLPVIAALGSFCSNEENLDSLMGCSVSEVLEKFDEIEFKKEVSVNDIMNPNLFCIREYNTLRELADMFYQKQLSYLPVVDDKGKLVGEVTVTDLISKGVPDYVKRLGNIQFMKTLEPFEQLLKDEDNILVKEIMRKAERSIARDASLIEVVTLISSKSCRNIPVMDEGVLVGVISEKDILEKVIRG